MSILVIGGTGKTGRRVTDRLRARGHDVRVAARSTGFHWDRPDTWAPHLAGARAVYLVTNPLSTDPSKEVADLLGRTDARVVLLSARDMHSPAEAPVRGHPGGWTILRPTWFAQNFTEDLFTPFMRTGRLALPAGEGREPFVDLEDVADVAVEALTDPRHGGRTYELSGPELLSFREAVALLGGGVEYIPVTAEEFTRENAGFGEEFAEYTASLLVDIANGANAYLSDGVQQVLGRAPGDFAGFAARVDAARTAGE
jgi:uncharacterized protein YbjT (DUF2867 family)